MSKLQEDSKSLFSLELMIVLKTIHDIINVIIIDKKG